jgi:hypothetical protein
MATIGIGAAIGLASNIIQSQLAQHTARLKDAQNENEAVDQVVPAFDADMKAIAQAFNTGTPVNECIEALIQVDTNVYSYMHSLVGKTGTAWGGPTTAEIGEGINPEYSAACDKTCTVACCVYLNDLRPSIFGRVDGNPDGMIPIMQRGGGTAIILGVSAPPSQYGNYSRPQYTIELSQPPESIASQVLGQPLATTGSTSQSGVLAALTSNEIVAILGVLGGIILIVTALFGQNALRVNR